MNAQIIMKPSIFLGLLAILVLAPGMQASVEDQVGAVTAELWKKVAGNWLFIGSGNLNDFFLRYVNDGREFFNLLEVEFTSGVLNWIVDFNDLGMTELYSRVYYRLLDVYEGTFGTIIRTLTLEDMDKIITIGEKLSDSAVPGILTMNQFVDAFHQVVFRGIGGGLLFVTYKTDSELVSFGPDHINREEFSKIAVDMDMDGNGEITSEEMGRFWEEGDYGGAETGVALFKGLDHNGDSVILISEMEDVFDDLDCRSGGNDYVDFKEFMQLDLILRGYRDYPLAGGECITDYTQFF